jgi:RHS repeat-associated protein
VASLDASSGTLTKTRYQPYGESGTTAGTFRYAGARIDAETNGLYDFGARIHSPVLGRFMQTDPIGYRGGVNLYAYVGNDPLNNVDATGLYTLQLGIAGGGTILGFVVPGGFGIAIDTQGNIGTYAYSGIGAGIGVEAGVGGSIQVSNAQTIYDLSGPFANTSIHGGAGLGGSIDLFAGSSPNGPVTGGGITFGASAGASASVTTTGTQVCGSQGCVGSPLPLVDLSTPASAAIISSPSK